jgi:hypothetical protein
MIIADISSKAIKIAIPCFIFLEASRILFSET